MTEVVYQGRVSSIEVKGGKDIGMNGYFYYVGDRVVIGMNDVLYRYVGKDVKLTIEELS